MLTDFEIYVINKVKEYRVKNKMSQAELADKINVTAGFIGKVESLKYNSKYNLNHINNISKGLQISPRDLLPNTYL